MKRMIFSLIFCFALAAFVIPAQASTVWYPTDSGEIDVNFITLAPGFPLAIFDDNDTGFSGLNLTLRDPADTILFSQKGSDWDLVSTETGNTFTLTNSFNFMLALETSPGVWVGNTGFKELAFGIYQVSWALADQDVEITMIDAQPVPLPASVLMFGSGLLVLTGLRRRK